VFRASALPPAVNTRFGLERVIQTSGTAACGHHALCGRWRRHGEKCLHGVPERHAAFAGAQGVRRAGNNDELAVAIRQLMEEIPQILIRGDAVIFAA
jgi:hypothetical protein